MSASTPTLATLVLVLVATVGCSGGGQHVENESLAIYAHHFRASDPGFSGLAETFEMISWGGSDVMGFFGHLEGGVDGWSTLYSWMGILFDGEEWSQLGDFFELWFLF